jgi:quercetin dioxygenase-like cupin family protein
MELEEGVVHLKPGDVVIQRGTIHNWVNRGKEACVMAFILVATEGGKSTGW